MILLQRSEVRRYVRDGAMKMWRSFDAAPRKAPLHRGFRDLQSLDDVSLLPGTRFQFNADPDHDLLTYVREGGLLVRNKPQGDALIYPGWCQLASSEAWMTARASETAPAQKTRFILTSLRAGSTESSLPYEHKQFPFSLRQGKLRLLASPDGEADSLRLRQDVRLYSTVLEKGHHIVHPLRAGRGAWLHVVEGGIRLLDQDLAGGDGASLENEAVVSFTAQTASEVLLYDLA